MLKIFRKLFHAHVCVLSNQTLAIAYVRCKAFTQVNMQMNLRLITGELFHWSDHISCVAHVSLYCSHGYKPLWEKGLGKVWVEFFGHRGWYFLMVVCVNTCSSEQCNWMQVTALSIVCTFVPVLKSLLCIYLGEEVKASQAADDTVDFREPSAFATGLWTARRKETDRFITQDCSTNYN